MEIFTIVHSLPSAGKLTGKACCAAWDAQHRALFGPKEYDHGD